VCCIVECHFYSVLFLNEKRKRKYGENTSVVVESSLASYSVVDFRDSFNRRTPPILGK
jgi:hypothetical protein